MDRFRWCSDDVQHHGFSGFCGADEESVVIQQNGVRLYDGPQRTGFDNGVATLTTHRIIWTSASQSMRSFLALPLASVMEVRFEEGGGIVRSRTPKLALRLLSVAALANVLASLAHPLPWMDRWQPSGSTYAVVNSSSENHVKLGFSRTGDKEFKVALEEVLQAKTWATSVVPHTSTTRAFGAVGIGAIQRQQAARAGATDAQLEEAFDDLNKLISHARTMVTLSHTLANRVREAKGGQLNTDETAELRSAMLAAGITEDTETVGVSGSSDAASFHSQLARQLSHLITPLLTARSDSHNMGAGCVDLASAYCRLNRARGMQLVSPEDLLRACELLERERLPIRLKRFPSGLLVLQLASENEETTLRATATLVTERTSLTADELARATNLSVLLARERLLAAEEAGLVCRDDSEAGLRFYPNRFLTGVH